MDMDAYKVSEIIGSNRRFISPFAEPCSYYIVAKDGQIDEKMIERYLFVLWSQSKDGFIA